MRDFEQEMRDASYPFAMGSTSRGVWLEPAIRIMQEAVAAERERHPRWYVEEQIKDAPEGYYATDNSCYRLALISDGHVWLDERRGEPYCSLSYYASNKDVWMFGPLPTQDSEAPHE